MLNSSLLTEIRFAHKALSMQQDLWQGFSSCDAGHYYYILVGGLFNDYFSGLNEE
jgi:hypothetical protein